MAGSASEGPLGGKYVRLQPGTSKTTIEPGGTIAKTDSYRSLEDQVGVQLGPVVVNGVDVGVDLPDEAAVAACVGTLDAKRS